MVVRNAARCLLFDVPIIVSLGGFHQTNLEKPKNGLHLRHYLFKQEEVVAYEISDDLNRYK